MKLQSTGIMRFDRRKGWLGIDVSRDLGLYYFWFLRREFYLGYRQPAFDASSPDYTFRSGESQLFEPLGGYHITVSNKIHKKNKHVAFNYAGKRFKFKYGNFIKVGGGRSDFWTFSLPVYSTELKTISKMIGGFPELHVTIANTKTSKIKKSSLPSSFNTKK